MQVFKICVDETALRKNIFLGNDGLSLYGITEVFRTIGMKSLAVEGTNIELYSLLSEEKKPIIIMINEDDEYHYVVLYKTNNSKVFYGIRIKENVLLQKNILI